MPFFEHRLDSHRVPVGQAEQLAPLVYGLTPVLLPLYHS